MQPWPRSKEESQYIFNIFAIFNYIKGQVAIYLFSIQGGVFMYAGMESQYGGEWWAGF